ncbi:MAG: choice-of-anchor J domain-containing protein [Cryomorphaceae bacterium]
MKTIQLNSIKRATSFFAALTVAAVALVSANVSAQTLPYNFDFSEDPFANGWLNQSVIGTQEWQHNANFENASMSAFDDGCQQSEAWLISPGFDLSETFNEFLTVGVQRGFGGGESDLELVYSINYSGAGDPNAADWTNIELITNEVFTDAGIGINVTVDFGAYDDLQGLNTSGVYVAFKYVYTQDQCATWRIDEFTLESLAPTVPYNFDFIEDPFANGWLNQSVIGEQEWQHNANFENASMSAFASGCQQSEAWLISPGFDLSESDNEFLTVGVQRGFANGENNLELVYSINYSGAGDPNAADWTDIALITNEVFTDAGIGINVTVDFGAYDDLQNLDTEGVYVAFKYVYTEGQCATWRIDEFSLVSVSGPIIAASTGSITGLAYVEGEGPSESASYTITANNLEGTGELTVSASEGFEVSANDADFGTSTTFPFDEGALEGQPVTVYVRMAAGLDPGAVEGTISHVGGGASADLPVSGNVSIAPPEGSYFIDFEGAEEVKTGYAAGNVVLSGMEWEMTQALIGDLPADFKNGVRSARLRGYGATTMTMLEDKTDGLGTLAFLYAQYGNDDQVAYVAEYSTDGGGSWTQIGEEFTGGPDPATFSEDVNVSGNVRVRFVTVSDEGSDNRRLNIDDILMTGFESVAPSISANPVEITGLNYVENEGPSAAQSYVISAQNLSDLTGQINVTAPASFEISFDGSDWSDALTVNFADAGEDLDNNEIFVRLAGGLIPGDYTGAVTHTGAGAEASVNVSGIVDISVSADNSDFNRNITTYPNPTTDVVNVKVAGLGEGQFNFSLFDIAGKLVKQERLNIIENGVYQINLSELQRGVYLLNVTGNDSVATVRVVKN